MATTIYGSDISFESWSFMSSGQTPYVHVVEYHYPYPRAQDIAVGYRNKAWDTVAGEWVYWRSELPDVSGETYPGPGIFSTETIQYAVESQVLGRYMRV